MSEVYPATPPGSPPASDKATAPFSPVQVDNLNAYQASNAFHPFTCGNDDCPGLDGEHASLVAAADGWHCPACAYRQFWAHEMMADGSWRGISVRVGDEIIKGTIESGPPPSAVAPELAAAMAETREVRSGYRALCGEFGPSAQSGWSARVSLTVLNRHRAAAGLDAFSRTEPDQHEDITMRYRRERDEAIAENAELTAQLALDMESWPKCPDGCGCRLGLGDADRQECGCDGPCTMECRENGYPDAPSYRDLAVSHMMDERDHVVRELRLERDAARRERDAHKLRAGHYEGLWRAEHGLPPEGTGQDDEPARFQVAEARDVIARWDKTISGDTFSMAETLASHLRGMLAIIDSAGLGAP